MKKGIKIIINGDKGTINTEAIGFQGKGCQIELSNIEKILGTTNTERKAKPELLKRTTVNRIKR